MPTKDLSSETAGYEALNFETMLRECLTCGVLAIDSEGKIFVVSPEAERALHLRAAPGRIASIESLPIPLQSVIREAQSGSQPSVERRILLPPGNGGRASAFQALVFAAPTKKSGGAAVVLLRETSRAGQLEQNLQQLDRLASVGIVSASMAHEIKNALVAIKTFIDLLLEKNPDAELGEVVRREMGRLDAIVTHMLKFAAPAQPSFVPVRLHDILDHSLRVAQHRVANKVIEFRREFNASPDHFTGDYHRLEQAFANLLLNAVEAIGAEGELTVGTELVPGNPVPQFREGPAGAGFLRVKITDTGGGIAPEDLHRVFDPFFTTKKSGTGLGLPVTRRIIEEHHGTIEVESQLDKGTTFTIWLPRSGAHPR